MDHNDVLHRQVVFTIEGREISLHASFAYVHTLHWSWSNGTGHRQEAAILCMSVPWLLSLGFTISFSVLFSKLWRMNKLFHHESFRRVNVTEKNVLAPFATLFTLILAVLLTVGAPCFVSDRRV
jgi:hypothetical protein